MIDVVKICEKVLVRLNDLNYEQHRGNFKERLIFPMKSQAKGIVDRISEQELRLLFIEEFTKEQFGLFYSVETPTIEKYNFKDIEDGDKIIKRQSALHDMCIFERDEDRYKRILNIDFKHKTASKSIAKDILKLLYEKEYGAFILLVNNTNKGTLKNVFSKLSESFDSHRKYWRGSKEKNIEIIILSLEKESKNNKTPFLIHRKIVESNLKSIKTRIGLDWKKIIINSFGEVEEINVEIKID